MVNRQKKLWRVGKGELDCIRQAIEGGLTGEMTKLFETRFSEKFGTRFAIAVNSGTSALYCALAALNIGSGDEVIVPPLTFIAPAFAALYVGAIPVFADVDANTFTIDPDQILRKITSKTKAVITVSLYGLPPNLSRIMEIARRHNLKVIEDNAQCFLGKYKGKLAGTFGDISIFSFQRSKHMTTGEGGMAITDDEDIALQFKKFANLGYTTLTAKPISNENFKATIQSPDFKRHESIGQNLRMPEVCAAMGIAQLEKLEMLVEKRIAIARLYEGAIRGCDWLVPQKVPEETQHTYWTFALKLDATQKDISWWKFRSAFLENGGEPFYGAWSLNYLEPALEGKYQRGLCPVAESLQPHLIQLKTNFEKMEHAQRQAEILAKTIQQWSGMK